MPGAFVSREIVMMKFKKLACLKCMPYLNKRLEILMLSVVNNLSCIFLNILQTMLTVIFFVSIIVFLSLLVSILEKVLCKRGMLILCL